MTRRQQSSSAKFHAALGAFIKVGSDAVDAAQEWRATHHGREISDGVSTLAASGYDDVYEAVTIVEQLHTRVVVECQTTAEILDQLEPEPAQTGGAR